MSPIWMLFKEQDGSMTYVYSYDTFEQATSAAANLNLTKGPNTTYTIIQGYRYGQ